MFFAVLLLLLAVGGRWACSWVCPMGFIQDLMHRIPFGKKLSRLPGERHLRKIKYVLLGALCLLIPLGIIPGALNGASRLAVKLVGFSTVFLLAIPVYRPFCKYLCPFGVVLGAFNKVSVGRLEVTDSCNKCGLCRRKCPMDLTPYAAPNHMECICCGACMKCCPRGAIQPHTPGGKEHK